MEWEPRDLPENNVTDVHPLRELAVLLLGIGAATVTLTIVFAVAIDGLVRMLPADWEARAFSGLWEELDPIADERLPETQALLDRLSAHWPENPYPLRLFVIESSEPNAFALPGGAVGITSGLLDRAGSENELAFVLAHELGHFEARHHLRGVSRSLAVGLVLGAVTGGSSGKLLTQWISHVTQLGFAREHELEADRFGFRIVALEYGHTAGATDFFERLPGVEGAEDAAGRLGRMGQWLATHPVSPERIEALRRLATQNGWHDDGELTPLYPHEQRR